MSHWDSGLPPAGRPGPAWPYGPGDEGTGSGDGDEAVAYDEALPYPVTWERDPAEPPPWPDAPYPGDGYPGDGSAWPADDGGHWLDRQAPPWAGD